MIPRITMAAALALALLGGSLALSRDGSAETKPAAKAAATATAAADDDGPAILLLGDSMMKVGVGPVLTRRLSDELDADVTMAARAATGLSRPDFYDWPARVKELLQGRHFDKAVVYLGTNDCQDMTGGEDPVRYGTPAWEKTYRGRVKDLLAQLCAGADKVLWLELPPMRNRKFNNRITALNALLASEVKGSACGTFVNVAMVLANAKGGFSQYRAIGKKWHKIRDDDGVHITQHGGRLVTEALLPSLR